MKERENLIGQSIIFAISFLAIVVKNILFQWYVFEDLYFHNAAMMFKFYGGTIALAAFLSCPIFILKRPQWWMTLVLLLIDGWIIAVLVNYRAWGVFMNMETIMMADNMNGFWNSVWIYFTWRMASFIIITCLANVSVFVLCHDYKITRRNWMAVLIICCISYL